MLAEPSVEAPRSGALGLHEGISHPGPERRWELAAGCPRWPAALRLLSSQGELVRGRCRSTNQCDYCARLAAVENSEMLALDAMLGVAPTIVAILGTRDPERSPKPFYRSRECLMRALKRRWPAVQYCGLVEFTTGYGPRSGGKRRPHWNLLLKGIPVEDVDQARDLIVSVWCAREDAAPQGQYVAPVSEVGGLLRYVALHFQKASQKPPEGWRGHRVLKSRGYLWCATPVAREAAKRSLRLKREIWRAQQAGADAATADAIAEAALLVADQTTWQLVTVDPSQDVLLAPAPRSGGSPAPALGNTQIKVPLGAGCRMHPAQLPAPDAGDVRAAEGEKRAIASRQPGGRHSRTLASGGRDREASVTPSRPRSWRSPSPDSAVRSVRGSSGVLFEDSADQRGERDVVACSCDPQCLPLPAGQVDADHLHDWRSVVGAHL